MRTDTVRGFVEERCEIDFDGRVRETALYEDYRSWCQQSSRHPLAKSRFREHLGDVFPTVEWHRKHAGYPTWFGIRLAP